MCSRKQGSTGNSLSTILFIFLYLKSPLQRIVPLIMAHLWLWEVFLLSSWTEALTCFQDTILWVGLALLQYLRCEDWSNLLQVGPVVMLPHIYFWDVLTANKNTEPTYAHSDDLRRDHCIHLNQVGIETIPMPWEISLNFTDERNSRGWLLQKLLYFN